MVEIVLLNSKPFDCGSVKGYIEVIKDIASKLLFRLKSFIWKIL